jgi:lipopolysaccharide transport system ATP-binding protein
MLFCLLAKSGCRLEWICEPDMNATVIQGEGLGKRYRRGGLQQSGLLRDQLSRVLKSPLSVFRRPKDEIFWALKDVSLEVREGEVLGLIGRNGAGKTTLLKILSRITRPTTGWAEITGRVGTLLEVGTGFHPELTGRENTYLNGAILGMGKQEISGKFDEIVAFAELEKFIDTPVKHYSSGMYVRLAFAVAAHLEPEILLVDEVLAVGDIRFQKKCLGKMGDVARAGRTVLLVSHNMAAINSLSTRVILLKDGCIEFSGAPSEATARYYVESVDMATSGASLLNHSREGNGKARFSTVSIQPESPTGEALEVAYPGCDLRVETEIACQTEIADCNLAIIIYDMNGFRVIDTNTAQKGEFVTIEAGQRARASFLLHDLLLKPGKYFIGLWLGRHTMETVDHVEHAAILDVMENEETTKYGVVYPGVYLCRFENSVSVS